MVAVVAVAGGGASVVVAGAICVGAAATGSPGTAGWLSALAPMRLLLSVPATRPATDSATAIRVRLARCVVPGAFTFMSLGTSLVGMFARTGDRPRYRPGFRRP